MANRNAPVECGNARCEGRRRVAVHQDYVGSERIEDSVKPLKRAAGYAAGALRGAHEIEIEIWNDVEEREYLIEHLSVLCGHTHAWIKTGVYPQRVHEWRHLDRRWPRAKHAEDLRHGSP